MTAMMQRAYLTRESALRSILDRMVRLPSYRPGGFAVGQAGVQQAAGYLEDLQEATRDLSTEGDS